MVAKKKIDLALFGNPEAGNNWESLSFTNVRGNGWVDAPEFPSVFKEPKTKAMLTCYVDDFDVQASASDSAKHWKDLEKVIEFKDPPRYLSEEQTGHLGCHIGCTRPKRRMDTR